MNLTSSTEPEPLVADPGLTGLLPLGWRESPDLGRSRGVSLVVDGCVAVDAAVTGSGDRVHERVIEYYRRQGLDFLQRLRGSFCIILWDADRRRLVVAADPFGTRPIYFWQGNGVLAFAPRLSSFADRSDIPKRINANSLYFYVNYSFIPAPFTIYRDIKRLEPGQYLIWEGGKSSLVRYWDMAYPEDHNLGELAAATLVRSSVEESIRFLIRNETHSGEELGAFLSGGTDSSTVVGLLTRVTGKPTKSFSVGFDEDPYNEIHYARIAAAHFGSRAHECFVRPKEALEAVPRIAEQYDEPFGNSSAIPTYFCLKAASASGVKVMFAGDGGDELFGGNERYLTEKIFSLYHHLPRGLRKMTDGITAVLPPVYPLTKIKNYVQKANLPAVDRFFAYQLYYRDHAREFFTDDFCSRLDLDFVLEVPRKHYDRVGEGHWLNRLLYLDLKLAIADNDLFKVNRMAESHGIRVCYPFLDKEVASASAKIPADLKLKGSTKRYVFKLAFEPLLPEEILRKKKHGFGLPTGDWLRQDRGFRELARSLLLDRRSVQRGYFKQQALENLLRQHDQEPSGYYGSHIWNLMMLELWHRCHFDRI